VRIRSARAGRPRQRRPVGTDEIAAAEDRPSSWACTSTPGSAASSGVALLSTRPVADVPTRTSLSRSRRVDLAAGGREPDVDVLLMAAKCTQRRPLGASGRWRCRQRLITRRCPPHRCAPHALTGSATRSMSRREREELASILSNERHAADDAVALGARSSPCRDLRRRIELGQRTHDAEKRLSQGSGSPPTGQATLSPRDPRRARRSRDPWRRRSTTRLRAKDAARIWSCSARRNAARVAASSPAGGRSRPGEVGRAPANSTFEADDGAAPAFRSGGRPATPTRVATTADGRAREALPSSDGRSTG